MRFVAIAYALTKFPEACSKLTTEEVARLVFTDGYLFLADPVHWGFSHMVWKPLCKYWEPYVKRLA